MSKGQTAKKKIRQMEEASIQSIKTWDKILQIKKKRDENNR